MYENLFIYLFIYFFFWKAIKIGGRHHKQGRSGWWKHGYFFFFFRPYKIFEVAPKL